MTLKVAEFANRYTLEASKGAFAVDLAAKRFLSGSARCICCKCSKFVGVLKVPKDLSARSSSAHPVVELVFMQAGLKVRTSEEEVRVQVVTHGHGLSVGQRQPRSRMICLRFSTGDIRG